MNLKLLIRKILPFSIRNFLYLIKNRKFRPFSLKSSFIPDRQYSDFFLYNSNYEENIFIAENSYALTSGEPVDVIHKFRFYSNIGEVFYNFEFESSEFMSTIKLPKLKTNSIYSSFTHHVYTSNKEFKCKNFILNHRGYSILKKKKDELGSIYHGNLGGLARRSYCSVARKRNHWFKYIPVYKFEKENTYHLVFNNPTSKKIKIIIQKKSNSKDCKEKYVDEFKLIKAFGCDFFVIDNFSGSIGFVSQLPICRAIVIKNPDIQVSNFDIFHS